MSPKSVHPEVEEELPHRDFVPKFQKPFHFNPPLQGETLSSSVLLIEVVNNQASLAQPLLA